MPWLSILMALITFFTSKKKDGSNTGQAALLGLAAGAGTYYVTHETEWGRDNLGFLDGVVKDKAGSAVISGDSGASTGGTVIRPPVVSTTTNGWDVLKDWGAAGTTGAVLAGTGTLKNDKWLLWGGVALLAILLLR